MNGRFRRNTLLANTALILLSYIWGVFVHPRTGRKLLGRQTDRHRIPKLVLPLSLPKTHKRIATKQQLDKIEWNIKMLTQRLKGGNRTRDSSRRRRRPRQTIKEIHHLGLIVKVHPHQMEGYPRITTKKRGT
jgi:hypothetical protein